MSQAQPVGTLPPELVLEPLGKKKKKKKNFFLLDPLAKGMRSRAAQSHAAIFATTWEKPDDNDANTKENKDEGGKEILSASVSTQVHP